MKKSIEIEAIADKVYEILKTKNLDVKGALEEYYGGSNKQKEEDVESAEERV